MAMNEEDFNKIKRRPNQKIIIRDVLEDIIKTGKVSNSASGTDSGKRETKVSISDGRPTPATIVCYEDSNFSVKEEEIQDEKTNTDDKASSVMMQLEDVQTEPLDLSCKKNKLKKMQSSTQTSTSVEWYLNKPSSLASSTSTISRAGQTCAIPGPYKLSFQYELSRYAPYHKPVPHAVAAYCNDLGHGYFVPGQPSKVTQIENGMEIRLRHPRKWKEQNHQLPQSTCTKTSSCIDPVESQPLSLSEPDSSQPLTQPSLIYDCHSITSMNPQLSACDIGQPIITFPGINQPFIASSCNSYSSSTTTSVDGHPYSPSTPDRGQPNMSNMGITLSNYTESISTSSSQEKSSFVNADEESHMDTGSTTSLPNIPDIFSNVNDWEQPNFEHEQLKKRLKKKITSRSKAPD